MDKNQLTMFLPIIRSRLFPLSLLTIFTLATLMVGNTGPSFALDPFPRSPRVGSLRIPLQSYNRVPIANLLPNITNYHLREIRIAGTVRTIATQIMTRGCGRNYELTVISLEDESGTIDVFDQGACGRNTSPVRAPALAIGDRVDMLVHVIGKPDGHGGSLETFTLWIERAQD